MSDLIPFPALKLLYPIREPNYTRDRPLQVLALGLGRTGTDSLQLALTELGYSDVYHGWKVGGSESAACPQWTRLSRAKFSHRNQDLSFLNREEFDKVLGHSAAVTDLPCAAFGPELLRAYPDAKVILNRRDDVDVWYESQRKTIDTIWTDWRSILRACFERECFWVWRLVVWNPRALYEWDFQKNGKTGYAKHYDELEAECRSQGREWLDWRVQDGWEPLCEFLEKPIPDHPFPNENAMGGYAQKRVQLHIQRMQRADRNIAIAGVVATASLVAAVSWYVDGHATLKEQVRWLYQQGDAVLQRLR
ncbi:Uu.00g131090.m01.CDS01 [Anthostomella pinea]|uniref:Uu.00g131090.m01.CDS01 n=1 Tax=Anthostomella pinea TaxID=933095 RepID=A0AAI8YI48_9PEZI|nr:Uu.00g131090.m01.CDS01 [Anthostomella pinea]